jgi:site-specific DNA-cytosine methylase
MGFIHLLVVGSVSSRSG